MGVHIKHWEQSRKQIPYFLKWAVVNGVDPVSICTVSKYSKMVE
jgi:hypothetical protein